MLFPLRDKAPHPLFPWVNTLLIGLNSAVFLYEWSLPRTILVHRLIPALGLSGTPYLAWFHGAPVPPAALIVPIFTSMFLHGSWLHLLGNMWMLYLFGDNVEALFGHFGYLLFYLFCGVIAGITQLALTLHTAVPMIGASGAIAGVMGAYLIHFPRARVTTLVFLILFFFLWDLPAWAILGYWFLIQFVSGLGSLAFNQLRAPGGIAFFAHVGGFLTGMLLGRGRRPLSDAN